MAELTRVNIDDLPPNDAKKLRITLIRGDSAKTLKIGSRAHESFPDHKDEARKLRYIGRHRPREDWSADGVNTAGFWARAILWNLPTVRESAKKTGQQLGVPVYLNGRRV